MVDLSALVAILLFYILVNTFIVTSQGRVIKPASCMISKYWLYNVAKSLE